MPRSFVLFFLHVGSVVRSLAELLVSIRIRNVRIYVATIVRSTLHNDTIKCEQKKKREQIGRTNEPTNERTIKRKNKNWGAKLKRKIWIVLIHHDMTNDEYENGVVDDNDNDGQIA